MVADEVEKLNGVFTSITEDIQNPSTKVTLDDKVSHAGYPERGLCHTVGRMHRYN